MVESLFNGLLSFFLFIVKIVGSIFIYPIQAIFVTLVPQVGDFLSDISSFFTETLFPFLCFLKHMILNITCCPPALFSLLISTFFGFLSFALTLRVFVLIYRIYLFVRGAKA